jgi:hypothetical protein
MADLRCAKKSKAATGGLAFIPLRLTWAPSGCRAKDTRRFSLGRLEKHTLAHKAFLRPPNHNARPPLPAALVR